jgi:hypothetical protein
MQRGGGDQRSRKPVEFGGAGVVIVIVGAGGADRVGVAIDGEQQPVSGGEQEAARKPAGFLRQLRQQSEKGDTQQNAGAEGHYHLHALTKSGEPQSQGGAGDTNEGGQQGDGDSREITHAEGQSPTVAQAPRGNGRNRLRFKRREC